ncbi:hypothetical protein KPP03845_200058 (plasmid) [Streptomyces xanthophaeus]|nr:hypothetical protein KPP03845_200058 [Streptomyces xanthophaeus]
MGCGRAEGEEDSPVDTGDRGQAPVLTGTPAGIWAGAHPELVDAPGAATHGLSVPVLRRQITKRLKQEGVTPVCALCGPNEPAHPILETA